MEYEIAKMALLGLNAIVVTDKHPDIREALEIAVECVDKQIPEDVLPYGREWICPACGEDLDFNNKMVGRCKCGKKVRWER